MVVDFFIINGYSISMELASSKAISYLKDSIVQNMGWKTEKVNILNINLLDTMISHATLY